MTAARTGKIGPVTKLLAKGAHLDAKDRKGQTALMWAAAEGHAPVVGLLIKSGADFRCAAEVRLHAVALRRTRGKDGHDACPAQGGRRSERRDRHCGEKGRPRSADPAPAHCSSLWKTVTLNWRCTSSAPAPILTTSAPASPRCTRSAGCADPVAAMTKPASRHPRPPGTSRASISSARSSPQRGSRQRPTLRTAKGNIGLRMSGDAASSSHAKPPICP